MKTLLIVVHVVCAIFGFGVVTAFPFIGMMSRREPASAVVLAKVTLLISRRVIYPAAVIQLLTGIALILNEGTDLKTNAWLGASIALFLIVLGFLMAVMAPLTRRLIAALETTPGTVTPDAGALMLNARTLGMLTDLGLLAIIVLMVWKPGAA